MDNIMLVSLFSLLILAEKCFSILFSFFFYFFFYMTVFFFYMNWNIRSKGNQQYTETNEKKLKITNKQNKIKINTNKL